MIISRNKLYFLLFIASLVGYIWLYINHPKSSFEKNTDEVCLIKHVTNIPCPSCGTTRSVLSIINGDFISAFNLNPIGYIIAFIILVAPVWIIIDVLLKNKSLFILYSKFEFYLKKPIYSIPLILLVILNWIWNISKGI